MKKFISIILVFIMTVSIFPVCVSAENETELKFGSDGKFKIMIFADLQDDDPIKETTIQLMNESLDKYTPDLVGKSVSEAHILVSAEDLTVKIIGQGDTVVGQYPEAGRGLPSEGMVVLYTQKGYKSQTVTVPDFTGLTVSEANTLAMNSGLNIRISGSSLNSGTVYAYKQSREAGETVNMGEIINVSFKTTEGVAD